MTIPPLVTKLGHRSFSGCINLGGVRLKEGLQVIGASAFYQCKALQSVTIPSTCTYLGKAAFGCCANLSEVIFLSDYTKLGKAAIGCCTNLSEVIFLGGKRLLNQDFVARGLFSKEQGLLNERILEALVNTGRIEAFSRCQSLTTVKISITWALSERMARLPQVCRLSVEERMHGLRRLELQDGDVLACFPIVTINGGNDVNIQDTNLETTRSLHQVLQLIVFHELKEASILIELTMWKSSIYGAVSAPRAECRVSIPDPAKCAIMEYCGFAGFLVPSID